MVLVGMICLYFVIMSQQRFTFLNQEKFFYVKNLSQASLVKYFDFFPKTFFQKFELPISECGLSAGVYSTCMLLTLGLKALLVFVDSGKEISCNLEGVWKP